MQVARERKRERDPTASIEGLAPQVSIMAPSSTPPRGRASVTSGLEDEVQPAGSARLPQYSLRAPLASRCARRRSPPRSIMVCRGSVDEPAFQVASQSASTGSGVTSRSNTGFAINSRPPYCSASECSATSARSNASRSRRKTRDSKRSVTAPSQRPADRPAKQRPSSPSVVVRGARARLLPDARLAGLRHRTRTRADDRQRVDASGDRRAGGGHGAAPPDARWWRAV
jgi:hypothetical protein